MSEQPDPKAAVNPAARRDPPRPPAEPRSAPRREPEVDGAQEEPLNPLDPGGIGA